MEVVIMANNMSTRSFRTSGHVVDAKVHGGVPSLRVEGWDKERLCHDLVACEVTGALGDFQIALDGTYLRELFADRRPVLFFKVFQGNQLVARTEDTRSWRACAGS